MAGRQSHQTKLRGQALTGFGRDGQWGTISSPYALGLIAERQGYLRSVSESGGGELRNEEEVLQSETSDCDMATEVGQLVLVGLADLFDDALQSASFQQPRDL